MLWVPILVSVGMNQSIKSITASCVLKKTRLPNNTCVPQVLSNTEVMAKALNSAKLGQRKNMALPGLRVDIPVLTDKDIDDVQNFACKNKMDIISASFVQSPEDVMFIRKVLVV